MSRILTLARPNLTLVPTPRTPVITHATRRHGLIASAAPIAIDLASSMEVRRTRQARQQMAWQFFRGIGAAWYASTFKANAISQLRIFPAEQRGTRDEAVPIDDAYSLQQVVLDDMANGFSGMELGHAPILASAVLQDSVAGEGYWYSRPDDDTGENRFEILSIEELELGGPAGYQIRRYPGAIPEPILPERGDKIARMWTPDPMWKDLATSPMLVQHDTLEELWLLIQAGIGAAKSRLAIGDMLTIPDELDLDVPAGPDDQVTPFEKEYMRAAATAIKDPASPARWAPLLIRGKADLLKPEFIHTIRVFKDLPKEVRDAILELRTRFAHDFDLPTELLTGLGDMTHWNAWIVDSMTWPHLRPVAQRVLANLTVCAYRPLLIAGGMDPREAATQVIGYDEGLVTAKPDRSAAATVGVEHGFVGNEAWMRSNGFDPVTDAPSEIERARIFGMRWGDPGLASVGSPAGIWDKATGRIATRVTETEKGIPGESPVQEDAGPAGPVAGPPAPGPTPGPPAVTPGPPVPAGSPPPAVAASGNGHGPRLGAFAALPPADPAPSQAHNRARLHRLGTKLGAIDRDLLQRISVLADDRLHGIVRSVGSKLRSAAQGRPVAPTLKGVDPLQIPRLLGARGSHALGLNDHLEVDAAAASFAAKAVPWLTSAQQAALRQIADATDQDYEDIADSTATDRAGWLDAAEAALTAGFTSMALGFLYNPSQPEGPGEIPDTMAPRGAIRQALQLAGGGDPGSGVPLGIGTGPMAQDALDAGGAAVDGWTWDYSDSARTTFPGHLALDGIEFSSWEDDQLLVQPEDDWVDTAPYYSLADHPGCQCGATPTVIPAEDLASSDGQATLVGAEA